MRFLLRNLKARITVTVTVHDGGEAAERARPAAAPYFNKAAARSRRPRLGLVPQRARRLPSFQSRLTEEPTEWLWGPDRPRVICVTIRQSHNRGCTIA